MARRPSKRKLKAEVRKEQEALKAGASAKPSRLEIANNIKTSVGLYFKAKGRKVAFELGLCKGGRLRADIVAVAFNGYTVVTEVKSSVADFSADKKMKKYLKYSNQVYCAMTRKVYLKVKDDIDPNFGVFIMTKDGTDIKKVLRAKKRELTPEIAQSLALRMLFRAEDTTGRKNRVL